MMLRACSGTVDRARSGFGPPFMARTWEPSITAPGPVQSAGGMQFGQQRLVQTLPDTRVVPVTQSAPAGQPRAEAQFLGQELPRNPVVEHEQDAGQDLPVIQTLAARVIQATRH